MSYQKAKLKIIYKILGSNQDSESSSNKSNGQTNEEGEQSSLAEKGNDGQKSKKEDKIKYELKQDSVLTANDKPIDWDYIKTNSELLYSNWARTVLDLHSLNVDNQDILSFGSNLDNLIIAAKNENKIEILRVISILYSYIPKFEEKYSNDTKNIFLQYTKYYVLNSYFLVEENNWSKIRESLEVARNYFSNIINTVSEDKNNQNKISKVYVLLNELNNSIRIQDKEVFYIKYKTLMDDLSNL